MGMTPDRPLYIGTAYGGPLARWPHSWASRCPRGILAVSVVRQRCWVYDWFPGNRNAVHPAFVVRESEGRPLVSDPDAPDNRHRAAAEPDFDVVAVN